MGRRLRTNDVVGNGRVPLYRRVGKRRHRAPSTEFFYRVFDSIRNEFHGRRVDSFSFFFLGSGSSVVARFLFVFHVVELIAVPFGRQSEKKNSVKTRYKDVVVVVLMKQERLVPFLELFFCCCCCLSTERLHFYGHQHRTRRTRRDFDNVPFVCVMLLLLFFFRFFLFDFLFFCFSFFFWLLACARFLSELDAGECGGRGLLVWSLLDEKTR